MKKKPPKWIKAVPATGTHGSGTLQKRLWRLISDYTRIRDFHSFGGVCVATGAKIGHWSEGDAGHYISYSVCRGMFKFYEGNIHLQSKRSNSWGGFEIGNDFANELLRRGYSVEELKKKNRDSELKVNDTFVIEKMRDIIQKMGELKEQPEYYERVTALLNAL